VTIIWATTGFELETTEETNFLVPSCYHWALWYDKWLREDRQTRLPQWFWHVAICSVVSYLYCTVWKRMDDFTRFSYIFFIFFSCCCWSTSKGLVSEVSSWKLESREVLMVHCFVYCLQLVLILNAGERIFLFFIKSFNLVRNLDLCIRFFFLKKKNNHSSCRLRKKKKKLAYEPI
jgi:hypothetical protein